MYNVRSRSLLSMIMVCAIFYHLLIAPAVAEDNKTGVDEKTIGVLKRTGNVPIVSIDRMIALKPDMLVEMIGIKPGMNIADIGAGVGVFTFPFADKLKGTGKVYAIEIYKPNLDCIARISKEKGYINIVPALIDPSNSEAFYKTHSFDIIFICEVLVSMFDIRGFLEDIVPSLKKDTGRLFIIELNIPADIDETDIQSSPEFFQTISAIKEDHPIFRRLSKESRDIVTKHAGTARPSGMGGHSYAALIKDLNAMLEDQVLFYDLAAYYFINRNDPRVTEILMENPTSYLSLFRRIPANHRSYMGLLISELDNSGAFQKKKDELTYQEVKFFRTVNKLLLRSILHISSPSFDVESRPYSISRSKNGIILKAKDAGLELVSEHDVLPKFFVLEFRRKD